VAHKLLPLVSYTQGLCQALGLTVQNFGQIVHLHSLTVKKFGQNTTPLMIISSPYIYIYKILLDDPMEKFTASYGKLRFGIISLTPLKL
jgi:hypothetical protein